MPMYNSSPRAMIELKILWDGDVPGIAEHRLSVANFGLPLRHLLMAVRRTANNIIREAHDRKTTNVGRFVEEAGGIDIHIASIIGSSVGVESIVSVQVPVDQSVLWPEGLAEDSIDRVLSDIERESKGSYRNPRIRDYFHALPPGLTKQDYYLVVDGQIKREVHLGTLELSVELEALPYLLEVEGRVIGVGFEPGKNFVRIKSSSASGTEMTLTATPEQVITALEIRGEEVRILGLVFELGRKKLLRIQPLSDARVRLNSERYVFGKWDKLLGRLAQ